MIYGIGKVPDNQSTCKVVPAALGGFFQFRKVKPKKPKVEPVVEEEVKMMPETLIETLKAKRHKKMNYVEVEASMPDPFTGVMIQTPDYIKEQPCDFLLTSKIQKRNTRPMTVEELSNQFRKNAIDKLEFEIRHLQ
jgi:hypothetical protein